VYLRIAEPIEQWDGTGEDPAAELAAQPDWSLYEVGTLSPVAIVATFFGNRSGHNPMRPTGYVLFTEAELLATGGAIHVAPANFEWPPEIADAHRDLMGHERGAGALFATYDPRTRLQTISRATLLGELAVLASRDDVVAKFRTNVVKRLRRVQTNDSALWAAVIAACTGRADLAALIA
jgi:hypothetical protein